MRASWCELFRHFPDGGVDPFEIRRKAARLRLDDVRVLDLTDARVRSSIGVQVEELVGDDYAITQKIAEVAFAVGLDGILAPAAALPGARTLVLFKAAIDAGRAREETSKVQRPPVNLADYLDQVRPVPSATPAYRRFLRTVQRKTRQTRRRS